MLKYIKMLRIKHWIKNGIVFLPLFFGGKLFSDSFFKCCLGFLGFSLISSCVYIINDIFDVDKDRLHSEKCKRPIASGEISIKKASVIAVVCGIAGMLCVVFNWKAVLILAVYLILNILYSSGLKNIPIADVLILASGFVFRLILGSFITQIEVSSWLCLTVIAASFYLGLGKRRGE
ncbi:MAG: UbiA prenyltransferase family protein, partial [Ruminococcus sp.]|nr:UbiA prenyltransferase family protein [Candidatus Copronaster equi]